MDVLDSRAGCHGNLEATRRLRSPGIARLIVTDNLPRRLSLQLEPGILAYDSIP